MHCLETATFAGGCFWCIVEPFQTLPGVVDVIAGYTGGTTDNPCYEEVCNGNTGHYEAVQIKFDRTVITYEQLLAVFWRQIDPSDEGGQFADRGSSYQTAIFYHDEQQLEIAEQSKQRLAASGRFDCSIVTKLLPAAQFYPAEEYHQAYHLKNSAHYDRYKAGSGRACFIKTHWQDVLSDQQLQERLTPLQYQVTQNNATERPFDNAYWNHSEQGIYVDVVSGKALFCSNDKFDAGCGWPSFSKPIEEDSIRKVQDVSHGMLRIEVRSSHADSHLGHVFDDGPFEGGLRYCINSASLIFIPRAKMAQAGFSSYLKLFE